MIRPALAAMLLITLWAAGCSEPPSSDPESSAIVEDARDPSELVVGRRYRLSRSTLSSDSPDPGDPTMTMIETSPIPPSTVVLVSEKVETAGTIWYEVQVESSPPGTRWVSVVTLADQVIVELP